MKKLLICAFTIFISVVSAQVIDKNSNSGSLWSDTATNPFLDRTARKAGDLVTIIISESSSASFNATTTTQKKEANKIDQAIFGNFLGRFFSPAATGATGSSTGSGTTTAGGKVTAKITVVVKDVLPSGALLIEGTRNVTVNQEVQTFKLKGTIRRDDIRSDNSVLSENIADAEIKMEGKGTIYDRQRRGILTRILDWLF